MKIAIFGSTGTIGKAILEEALRRGHEVTAVVRDPGKLTAGREGLQVRTGDILMPDSISAAVKDCDVVISAYGPRFGEESQLSEATRSLIEGVRNGGVRRLIAVGGAGGLEAAPGMKLMETPEFPEEILPLARAHEDAYHIYRDSDIVWTVLSPAAIIEPGKRTGQFRIGMNQLVVDERDQSRISVEDYAVAMLDEAEDPQFVQARFTVAY
ncbi:3-beta hydroxysteroid dehydrogenase [Paenibacillus faecis]|uniref:NAD(P)-dependent oxidoreductase n=1 Tax=Paenibacillus faecis TaxID=862114 RepID=A0A5D0CR31_9BACL|nr:NAD(P)-dependent oxidoreductase [Paenibacillus faecis]TYA11555.1 NAD(P)-dependent oxidoreductase [Paenibacillus faecis]GIO86926.1 3-beta hydroxysteroid dehydrogenase [Paenibacillus faecis]